MSAIPELDPTSPTDPCLDSPAELAAAHDRSARLVAALSHLKADHKQDWACCDLPMECHERGGDV